MSKKLIIYFLFLIVVVTGFVCVCSELLKPRTPLTADKFTEIAMNLGYTPNKKMILLIREFDEKTPSGEALQLVKNGHKIEFTEFVREEYADELFNALEKQLGCEKSNACIYEASEEAANYSIYTARSKSGIYHFISKVSNTLIRFDYTNKDKADIEKLLNETGYNHNKTSLYGKVFLLSILLFVLLTVPYAYILKKANKPAWAVFVPFYNFYVLYEITYKNGALALLIFIPFIGILLPIFMIPFKLAHVFNKSRAFGLGLFFLNPIFAPILAFDNSEYTPIRNIEVV